MHPTAHRLTMAHPLLEILALFFKTTGSSWKPTNLFVGGIDVSYCLVLALGCRSLSLCLSVPLFYVASDVLYCCPFLLLLCSDFAPFIDK